MLIPGVHTTITIIITTILIQLVPRRQPLVPLRPLRVLRQLQLQVPVRPPRNANLSHSATATEVYFHHQ